MFDIEQEFLGSIISSENKGELLRYGRPIHFTYDFHSKLFVCLKKLFQSGSQIDLITIKHKIKDEKEINISDFLTFSAQSSMTPGNGKSYLRIMINNFLASHIKIALEEGNDIQDVLEKYQIDINFLNNVGTEPTSAMDLDEISDMLEELEATELNSISTGYKSYDKYIGGFNPGELLVLAGVPGGGKTALAINHIINVARLGKRVLFISAEMLSGEIVKRMFSVVLTRPYNDFCGLNGINNRMLAREEMYGWYKNIILSDKKKPTPNDIRELALSSECDFIVIDYLGFMGTDKPCKSRLEEIGNNVREIKNLAGELRIPILLLSQLNREGVKEGVRPQPYHLKESGEIEQTADKIVLLNKKQQIDTQDRDTVDIELIIAKNRNGPVTNDIGELELIYRKNCFRFYDR